MRSCFSFRRLLLLSALSASSPFQFLHAQPTQPAPRQQPSGTASLALDDVKPGQRGEVWTVFRGTEPEAFDVIVTGVLAPGVRMPTRFSGSAALTTTG